MIIFKTENSIETYRAKAKAKDINELSGRTGRPDLTKFVIAQMLLNIPVKHDSILVDIGCGNGVFLLECAKNRLDSCAGRLIGILPTSEEVSRVRNHILHSQGNNKHLICIELGTAEKTNIPSNYCDTLACNGVLLILQNEKNVSSALTEFYRVTKLGGTIFIGEMPDSNEMEGENYGDSISSWLIWVLKNQGVKSFISRLRQTVTALFSSEPFVVAPKNLFYMPPSDFIALLNRHGIEVTKHYRHKEVDGLGNVSDSKTRWNYIGIKR